MDWKDVKNFIGTAAPILGTVLGGPGGTAIGTLVSAALGVEDTPDAVYEALKADPQAILEVKKLEMAHKADLEKALIQSTTEMYKADKADVSNARGRDKELKIAGFHNYRADALAIGAFGSLCYIVYQINTSVDLVPQVLAIFNMSIGALLKMLGDVFAFEFGSSRGSKEKDILNK
jgi:hypothetical protein